MKNTIVIFGATGDLTRLKLLPAIDTLKEISGDEYNVIACGRREMTTEGYISYLGSIDTHPYTYTKNYSLRYIQLSYAPEHIENEELWSALKDPGRLLFFLALGPDAVMATLNILGSASARKIVGEKKATVVLEKPYGESLNNALEIVGRLNKIFGEKNVLLSDHYLHKRSVKSIDRLKVNSDDLLSAISPTNLTDVRVIISEQVDIGSRAGYFDCRGMVIDWVQSHILQLLSSILLPREYLDGNKKAEWKADFLKHLYLEKGSIIRGQYEGYVDTNGVNPDCGTETFFACRLRSKKAEWKNISFSVIAGKALKEKSVCLNLRFSKPNSVFGSSLEMCLEPAKGIEGVEQGDGKEYSALITSALCGDSTYFLSDPEMKAQWQIAEELQEGLSRAELKKYPKGISYKEFCNDKWCST